MENWFSSAQIDRNNGMSYREIARKYGKAYSTVQERFSKQEKDEPQSGSVEFKNGNITFDKLIEICEGEEITPEVIMQAHNIDPGQWEVVSYRNNYWHSQIKGGKRLVMYQSRLTVKPRKDGLSLADIDEHFKNLDRECRPHIYTHKANGQKMAEVNLADLHFGKLCWHGDTGNNFDYKIARDMFYDIIGRIKAELQGRDIEYILFVWANDFFNSDTIDKTTTGGTPQDTDVRWQKLFNIGVEMLVNGITSLSEVAPVKTFYTASNHDEQTGYTALKYLEAWFRNDPNVEIDTRPIARKYISFGKCLIGFTHGDKEKPKALSMLMPNEARELWGNARYCEMHTAHLHSEHSYEEINGVIVRRISSPTATDTWHYTSGYVGAVRKAQTFIWDKELGLEQIINTPVMEVI